jgi:hypothetical protein
LSYSLPSATPTYAPVTQSSSLTYSSTSAPSPYYSPSTIAQQSFSAYSSPSTVTQFPTSIYSSTSTDHPSTSYVYSSQTSQNIEGNHRHMHHHSSSSRHHFNKFPKFSQTSNFNNYQNSSPWLNSPLLWSSKWCICHSYLYIIQLF